MRRSGSRPARRESALYAPLRDYLVSQGYEVKSEVEHCDIVACRGDEAPVIVELKTTLNLELLLQATERLKLTPAVYVAFPGDAPLWRRHWRRVHGLCRRLGLGVITLDGPRARVNARLDPGAYRPRGAPQRTRRLLFEFERRVGDPNVGGITRLPLVTAYRQDVLRCVSVLAAAAPLTLACVRARTGLGHAAGLLQRDPYGWFERVARATYNLSPKGRAAVDTYAREIAALGGSRGR